MLTYTHEYIHLFYLLHRLNIRQQTQNGGTYGKLHVTKLRLNYSFGCARYGILNQLVRSCLALSSNFENLPDKLFSFPRGK